MQLANNERDGPKKKARRWGRKIPGGRPAASEILVTMRDGTTRTVVRARPWTDWLKYRVESESPGIASAELVRELTREEYLAIKPEFRKPGRDPVPATLPGLDAGPEVPPVAAPAPPPAAAPVVEQEPPRRIGRPPKPRPVPAPADPGRPFGWEVLIRQHGRTRTARVACSTEDAAVELMMALEGVDAATGIRPLTLEEFREVAD